jgi:CRISPR system Cascade subunit CasA
MRAPSFNLVDEPWLPCLTPEGRTCALSLREALQHAHELVELSANPPITAALTRLLIAVVHRVLDGPKDKQAWADTWGKGCFDPAAVDAYLDRWKARFDLFDPLQPFFQAPLSSSHRLFLTPLPPVATTPPCSTIP